MTICEKMKIAVEKKISEGKDIEEIGQELCSSVKYPKRKIIRIIKDFLGEEFLVQHATELGYDGTPQLKRAKEKKVQKIALKRNKDNEETSTKKLLEEIITKLQNEEPEWEKIVMNCLEIVKNKNTAEKTTDSSNSEETPETSETEVTNSTGRAMDDPGAIGITAAEGKMADASGMADEVMAAADEMRVLMQL